MPRYLSMQESATIVADLIANKTPLSFFGGAGISMHEPSFLPDWKNFRTSLLKALIDRLLSNEFITNQNAKIIEDELLNFDSLYGSVSNGFWLKPEVVLQWIRSYIPTIVDNSLKVFNLGDPNINHSVLAYIAKHSNTLIGTCNFDTLIEDSMENIGSKYTIFASNRKSGHSQSFSEFKINENTLRKNCIPLLKVHGCISVPTTIKATITQVSRPISQGLKDSFKSFISDRLIIVVGYSGRDLDILNEIKANATKSRGVLWLSYNENSIISEVRQISNVSFALGDLNEFFNALKVLLKIKLQINKKRNLIIDNYLKKAVSHSQIIPTAMALSELSTHIGCNKTVYILATAIINKSKNLKWIGQAWMTLGDSKRRTNPNDALKYFQKAEIIIKNIRHKYPLIYGHALKYLAAQNYIMGSLKVALSINTKCLKWIKKGKDKNTEARALDDRAIIFRQSGNINYAIKLRKRAINILEKTGDLISLSMVYNNLGKDYDFLENFPEAEKWWRKSITLKERETSNGPDLGRSYYNLAELLRHVGRFDEAQKYFFYAIYRARKHNDYIIQVRFLYSIAAVAYKRGKKNQARRYIILAQSKALKVEDWNSNPGRLEWAKEIEEMIING